MLEHQRDHLTWLGSGLGLGLGVRVRVKVRVRVRVGVRGSGSVKGKHLTLLRFERGDVQRGASALVIVIEELLLLWYHLGMVEDELGHLDLVGVHRRVQDRPPGQGQG